MRILEYSIRQYGPLPDTGRIALSDFNLFFGRNEDGKTLTIDAFVKMLFGQNRGVFERIERVDENPDGYVIIEDEKRKKIKLPEKGDLTKIAGISPAQCRNLFVIRNSDLSIVQETDCYTNVTDRLTGLRTDEISSIKQKLQEIGKLTKADSQASLSDDSKWGKIKTKMKKAAELVAQINELERTLKKEDFDLIEEEISKVTETIDETQRKINELEDARKREKYEKASESLEKLNVALENLKGRNLEEIQKLDSKIDNYEVSKEIQSSQQIKKKFLAKATTISAILSFGSIIGVFLSPFPFMFYLAVLLIIATAVLGAFEFSLVMKEVQIAAAFKGIKMDASRLGVGAENIGEIRSNIKNVNKNIKLRAAEEVRLDSYFGKKNSDIAQNISYWKNEVDKLEEYKDKAKNLEYSEERVSELKANETKVSAEKEKLQKRIQSYIEKLKEVERLANEILQLEGDHLHCDTSVDLDAIKRRLQDFKDEIENNKDNVITVMKIFEEIAKEEEEKISFLFGKGSLVSKYFSEITDEVYQNVEFTPDEQKIQVWPKNGKALDAQKLSGGAYDQLYLSIRLALGEKLLKGKKGFFIMDDPFIKADIDRLKRQMDIMKRISKSGWQILYFSAKEEIKDVLEKDIEEKKVHLIQLANIFS